MPRLLLFLAVAVLALDVFAIVDVMVIDRSRIRALNRFLWVLVVIAVPIGGALLWFFVGRDRGGRGQSPRVLAPDDDPAFLSNLRRDKDAEERIRRLEQQLSELDDDPDERRPS